ncbi:g9366 [Coccomyxa elongata]
MSETDSWRKDVWQTAYEVDRRKELLLTKERKALIEEMKALMAQRRALGTQMVLLSQLTGPPKLSLPGFLKVGLPELVYSHSFSVTTMYSKYALELSAVSTWTSFAEDVADFAASLDAADLAYSQPGFPETFLIQSEESVRSYMEWHMWKPLERRPTPLPFTEHKFWQPTTVGGLKGAPDWAANGYGAGSHPQLLLAIETKTAYSMPVPEGTSTASMYADKLAGPFIKDAVHQMFGYMHANSLRYGVLVTGEVYAFLERQGSGVRVADVRGQPSPADTVTPQMAFYYMLHKAAQDPGQLVMPRSAPEPQAPRTISSIVTSGLGAAVSRLLQPLRVLPAIFSKAAGQQGRQQLAPDSMSKDVWTWEELNLTGWIAQGRTGSVFEGCIGGSPVAVKVCDYGHRSEALKEVQRECEMLDYLREEQGQAVLPKVTQGYIAGSTCYFVAMELLGESLEEAPSTEHAALGEAALAALDRVHARGVLHKDVHLRNFLRAPRGKVVLTDFAFSELSDSDSGRQQMYRGFGLGRLSAPTRHWCRDQCQTYCVSSMQQQEDA